MQQCTSTNVLMMTNKSLYITLDVKHLGFKSSPVFTLNNLDLDLQMKGTLFFSSVNRTLDHTITVQSFFSLAHLRCFLHWPRIKSGLTRGTRQLYPECVWMWWFWKLFFHLIPLFLEVFRFFNLFDNRLKPTVVSFAGSSSSATFCPSSRRSVIRLDTALCEESAMNYSGLPRL